jgi:hypothetical protein
MGYFRKGRSLGHTRYNFAEGAAWPKRALEFANIAGAISSTGYVIAGSRSACTPTVIRVGRHRSCLHGTRECRDCPIVRANRKSAPRWSRTSLVANVEEDSRKDRRHDARAVNIRCPPRRLPRTLKRTRRDTRRAGIGNRTGRASTASSQRTAASRIISRKPHLPSLADPRPPSF